MLPRSTKRISVALSALLLVLASSMSACAGSDKSHDTTAQESSALSQPEETSSPNASQTDAPMEELRAYYDSVISALEEKLLEEKQDRYISDFEYKAQIGALRSELEAIMAQGGLQQGGSTLIPSVDTSDKGQYVPFLTLGVEETSAPDIPSSPSMTGKMSFRYGIIDGSVTIYEYLGDTNTVAIPSTIEGLRVTSIADDAFKNSSVTTVVIPPSVTKIGWFAFSGCTSLASISIPASVTNIGYAAFDGCTSITVLCPANSYAAEYAASFGMSYQVI